MEARKAKSTTSDNSAGSKSGPLAWIGIVSSIVTVGLTVVNGYTKFKIDQTDVQIKKREVELKETTAILEEALKERATKLEESKERTSRYTFVRTLLPDLMDRDRTKKELTINLIGLALNAQEAEKLFRGFSSSSSPEVRQTGRDGITITSVQQQLGNASLAREKEREGFTNLLKEDYDNAIRAFAAAEDAYNGYHYAYEITRLLKRNRSTLADPIKRKEILRTIVSKYSAGAPTDLMDDLRTKVEEP
jgi:hypothetical protein